MGWRDKLRPASWRGVKFTVLDSEAVVGRRGVVHEYPLRDVPWVEDMGRRARTYTLTAVLVGSGYMTRRDELIAALEQPGAGTLVHPYYGEIKAAVTDCRLRESTAEGGMVTILLQFVEAGQAVWPRPASSTADVVAKKANLAVSSQMSLFAKALQVVAKAAHVVATIKAGIRSVVNTVRKVLAGVKSVTDSLNSLHADLDSMVNDMVSLIAEPAMAAQALVGAVQSLARDVLVDPKEALNLLSTLTHFGTILPATTGLSPTDKQAALNGAQVARLVRTVALAESARAMSRIEPDSYEEAAAQLEAWCHSADVLMRALDDEAFDAMRALRAAVVADLAARSASLSRLTRMTPQGRVPALVLAHALYADATQSADVLTRNAKRVAHPLFVGGAELEVLASV